MNKPKGFSLVELMIAVGIILIIAAIAIPSLLRARIAANEASAVSSLRTINGAMLMYITSYPLQGYATGLNQLGSTPCHPDATTPCLIDGVLAAGKKSGYSFVATASGGPPTNKYYSTAVPIVPNQTGIRSFCSSEDGVIHEDGAGVLASSEAGCQSLAPLQGSGTSSGGSGGGGNGGNGDGSGNNGNGDGNGNNGNGNGNGNGNNGNGYGNGGGDGSNGKGGGNGNTR